MLSVLVTVPGRPLNGGTVARFIAEAMHAPLDVPANGASLTIALDTLPLGSKVTTIVALPAGPPFSRQLAVPAAAAVRAAFAALASKRCVGPFTPRFSSARRAPLANSSAKPAFGVAVGTEPGASSAPCGLEPSVPLVLPEVGLPSVAVGSLACVAVGAAAGSALIGAAGGGLSLDELVSRKITPPTTNRATTMPTISGVRLLACGHSSTPLRCGNAAIGCCGCGTRGSEGLVVPNGAKVPLAAGTGAGAGDAGKAAGVRPASGDAAFRNAGGVGCCGVSNGENGDGVLRMGAGAGSTGADGAFGRCAGGSGITGDDGARGR